MKSPQSTILVRFGQTVRNRRLEHGFTQEVLAEKAELHRTYIADIERGTRNISLRNIERIAIALESTLADLFSATEGKQK